VVIFGGGLVVIIVGWLRVVLRPDRLEVSNTEIRYVAGAGSQPPILQRDDGDEIHLVARRAGRTTLFSLYQPGSGTSVPLRLFARNPISQACRDHGWTFS
jgi:hypothetical protein